MYLSPHQIVHLSQLLETFFSLPYSTDLDGKDAETLLRIVKAADSKRSKRKELFDIIDGKAGYSVKTLFKSPNSKRVDLQEQRFCDVEEVRRLRSLGQDNQAEQGRLLLSYMKERIVHAMTGAGIEKGLSLILLKFWNSEKTEFSFRYWEEDFLGYIQDLWDRNERGEVEWVAQGAGLHARDRKRRDAKGNMIRLLRMHYKHNQIFTDHDIPEDAVNITFKANRMSWEDLARVLVKK